VRPRKKKGGGISSCAYLPSKNAPAEPQLQAVSFSATLKGLQGHILAETGLLMEEILGRLSGGTVQTAGLPNQQDRTLQWQVHHLVWVPRNRMGFLTPTHQMSADTETHMHIPNRSRETKERTKSQERHACRETQPTRQRRPTDGQKVNEAHTHCRSSANLTYRCLSLKITDPPQQPSIWNHTFSWDLRTAAISSNLSNAPVTVVPSIDTRMSTN
jgi:hypothetical protein